MRYIAFLVIILPFFNSYSQQRVFKETRILSFCTNVGPVEITIRGDSATGRYLLTVTPELKKGIIKGTYSKGLFEGTWHDPDGIGRIIIGFNPDLSKFLAMYNTSKDASHWYNEWKGVSRSIVGQLPESEKKNLSCQWK